MVWFGGGCLLVIVYICLLAVFDIVYDCGYLFGWAGFAYWQVAWFILGVWYCCTCRLVCWGWLCFDCVGL